MNVKIIGRYHLNSVLASGAVTDNVSHYIQIKTFIPKMGVQKDKIQDTVLYFNVEVCKNITCPVFKNVLILLHIF